MGTFGVNFLLSEQGNSASSRGASPAVWVDKDDVGLELPCAAGATPERGRPLRPRRRLALESKGKPGHAPHLPALSPPAPRALAPGGCEAASPSTARDNPGVAAVLSLAHARP